MKVSKNWELVNLFCHVCPQFWHPCIAIPRTNCNAMVLWCQKENQGGLQTIKMEIKGRTGGSFNFTTSTSSSVAPRPPWPVDNLPTARISLQKWTFQTTFLAFFAAGVGLFQLTLTSPMTTMSVLQAWLPGLNMLWIGLIRRQASRRGRGGLQPSWGAVWPKYSQHQLFASYFDNNTTSVYCKSYIAQRNQSQNLPTEF